MSVWFYGNDGEWILLTLGSLYYPTVPIRSRDARKCKNIGMYTKHFLYKKGRVGFERAAYLCC